MPLYEHVFLARQDISVQQNEQLVNQFIDIIEKEGGKVAKVEYWGARNLAYQINKNRKAHFNMLHIDADHATVKDMERLSGLNSDVIRHLTIRVDEFDPNPSVMMNRRERDRPHNKRD